MSGVNSESYWTARFGTGDWEKAQGRQQTAFFARFALERLHPAIAADIRAGRLSICDWGCALGDAVPILADAFRGSKVTGVDFAATAVERARALHAGNEFLCAPSLADTGRTFDVVFTSNTLEHFPRPFEVLESLAPSARRYLIAMVPFRELERLQEHLYTFDDEAIPLRAGPLRLVACTVFDTRCRHPSYWPGEQVLFTFARDEAGEVLAPRLSWLGLAELREALAAREAEFRDALAAREAEICEAGARASAAGAREADTRRERDEARARAVALEAEARTAEGERAAARRALEEALAAVDTAQARHEEERAELKARVAELSAIAEGARAQAAGLEAALEARGQELARAQAAEGELRCTVDEITGSPAWHLVSSFRRKRDRLAPEGSLRRKAYKGLLLAVRSPRCFAGRLKGIAGAPLRGPLDRLRRRWQMPPWDAYNPYDRLECLKPIEVQTWDAARVAAAGTPPPVSIVSTVFNEGPGIMAWLESIERQTLRPAEVVIVDGGSTDGTAEAVEQYARRPGGLPLQLIRSEQRINIARGRNLAIRAARHEVVLVTDCGCTLAPDWCLHLATPFTDPALDLAMGAYAAAGPLAPDVTELFVPSVDQIDPVRFLPSSRSVAFRRALWERCGGYPEWLTLTGEDTLFDVNARRHSTRWAWVPSAMVLWKGPASLEEGVSLAYRYGVGSGEAGLLGLNENYRFIREHLGRERARLLSLAFRMPGQAARDRSAREQVFHAQARGLSEGKQRHFKRLWSSGRACGNVLILAGVPFYDSGGGQRGTQMALAFLRQGYKVTFVNVYPSYESKLPVYLDAELELLELCSIDDFNVRDWRRRHASALRETMVVLEFPHPRFLPIVDKLAQRGVQVVYDCLDNWESSLGGDWYNTECERRVIDASTVLVASARVLRDRLEQLSGRPVHYLPQGVNTNAIDWRRPGPVPADLPPGQGPLLLYVGSLWGAWLDWGLVRATAEGMPEARILMVGEYAGQGGTLPPNVHFVGLKPHSALPGYLAAADVCLIPFTVDAVTRAVNPLKVFEYLAMAKPVVSSDLPELEGMPYVARAHDAADFIRAVEHALDTRVDPEVIAAFVETNSWDRRVLDLAGWASIAPQPAAEAGRSIP